MNPKQVNNKRKRGALTNNSTNKRTKSSTNQQHTNNLTNKLADNSTNNSSNKLANNPTNKLAKNSTKRSNIKRKMSIESNDHPPFKPIHLLRCHSRNGEDISDVDTVLWDVAFEPDLNDPNNSTRTVATCGANSICIIDVETGKCLLKYKHKDPKQEFFTLAWTTLELDGKKTNILASGSKQGEIRLYHLSNKLCICVWKVYRKSQVSINSLIFHSEKPNWVFCAASNGHVTLWDMGSPTLPNYDGFDPVELVRLNPDYGTINKIVWTGTNRWLLAGTQAGLVGWQFDAEKVEARKQKYKPQIHEFIHPISPNDNGEFPVVESLGVSSEWTISSKCAAHGLIYTWDLKATLARDNPNSSKIVVERRMCLFAKLKWSDTDDFYLNLGCDKSRGMICCGDEKGNLWLYDSSKFNTLPSLDPPIIDPTFKLLWSDLEDYLENVPLGKDRLINKVDISDDSRYIVAVTSNNIVCIWKRTPDVGSDIEQES